MSENGNRANRDFSKYDSMTTEELEEILRRDADSPEEGASDVELLLYVMEVLANRRRNTENTGKTALESWESFQQHYLSEEEDCVKYKPGKRKMSLPRRLIAAAAAVALVVCIPLTANAFGWEDIWNAVASWAKETFSFVSGEDTEVSEPESGDNLQYTSLQDALQRNGLDTDMIPTYILEAFTLEKIDEEITPVRETYIARYTNGERLFRIAVQSYMNGDPEKIEINEELLEIYECSDTQYYIFSNVNQIQVIWIKNSYECNISGELTVEEVKSMIDSIGKG